jgi:sphinganine-1-phosphate aldolase
MTIFDSITETFYSLIDSVDEDLEDTPASTIITGTIATVAIAYYGQQFLANQLSRRVIGKSARECLKHNLRKLPPVSKELQMELDKLERELEEKFFKDVKREDVLLEVPDVGQDASDILKRLENVAGTARNGKNTGAYYIDNDELDELILQVCRIARRTNPLHTDLSPLVRQLEAEIVRMTLSMFHGDDVTCGNVTSGGTDSIRHAVFTARERAKSLGQHKDWEMVIPATAHPAFLKAANEYCIKVRKAPVHPQGHSKAFQVDTVAMTKMMNNNTILVVGSTPGFPHGIIDPIEEISAILEEVDPNGRIGLHVDACLGGFILPWMEAAGYGDDIHTKFGFDVNRVTSISADTHKYGYAEKGTSVVMYKDHENWRKHQVFETTEWPGGIYASPTLPGSRSGRDIAATWAVMAYMGKEGYIEETRKIIEKTRALTEAIKQNKDLEILGDPKGMVVAFRFGDEEFNIYDLKSEMSKLEWYLSGLQKPAAIHFCTTAVQGNNENFLENFMGDLEKCIEIVKKYPPEKKGKSGDAVMYRTNTQIGKSIYLSDFIKSFWDIVSHVLPRSFDLE